MIQITIFGGREGPYRYDNTFYLTLFGACELTKPTLARQYIIARQHETASPQGQHSPSFWQKLESFGTTRPRYGIYSAKPFFLTVFGAASIKNPTLAEELVDLQELIRSGELSLDEWDRAMLSLSNLESSCSSFTLFAAFDESELPSEDEEVNSLAMQCHLGNISESSREILQAGIGLKESDRRAVVHRAVLANA